MHSADGRSGTGRRLIRTAGKYERPIFGDVDVECTSNTNLWTLKRSYTHVAFSDRLRLSLHLA